MSSISHVVSPCAGMRAEVSQAKLSQPRLRPLLSESAVLLLFSRQLRSLDCGFLLAC